ncbi:MAG TPA: class E sortase [Actinomycetota bacterium]|nr:class E sortase [Actinomycetota bacterium]
MPRPDPASAAGAGGPEEPGRNAGSGGPGSPPQPPAARPPRSPAAASLGPTAEALAAAARSLEADEAGGPALFDPESAEPTGPAGPAGPNGPAGPAQLLADPYAVPVAASAPARPAPTGGPPGALPGGPQPANRGGKAGRPPERRRGKPRKKLAIALIAFALVLILAGIAVAGYPFYTDVVAGRKQATLGHQLDQVGQETGAERLRALQAYASRDFGTGSPITYIEIPALNVKEVVVQGVTDEALNVGAGHYPQSPLPGETGNVAIAGHRTMNGHPFGDLNKLVAGDKIVLQTPFESFTYTVLPPFDGHNNPWIVQPTDWTVISFPTQEKLLTLTTCNPPGQQTNRLVARAVLTS